MAAALRKRETVLPPRSPSKEECKWGGGPGFNVALANSALQELLAVEQLQGYPFSVAAVGDGSWDSKLHDAGVTRASLLHDGSVLGGLITSHSDF